MSIWNKVSIFYIKYIEIFVCLLLYYHIMSTFSLFLFPPYSFFLSISFSSPCLFPLFIFPLSFLLLSRCLHISHTHTHTHTLLQWQDTETYYSLVLIGSPDYLLLLVITHFLCSFIFSMSSYLALCGRIPRHITQYFHRKRSNEASWHQPPHLWAAAFFGCFSREFFFPPGQGRVCVELNKLHKSTVRQPCMCLRVQCVAVSCSMLQCVALCCIVLHGLGCNLLQCVVWFGMWYAGNTCKQSNDNYWNVSRSMTWI